MIRTPWRRVGSRIADASGVLIIEEMPGLGDRAVAVLDRIIAAVNACDGIPTRALDRAAAAEGRYARLVRLAAATDQYLLAAEEESE